MVEWTRGMPHRLHALPSQERRDGGGGNRGGGVNLNGILLMLKVIDPLLAIGLEHGGRLTPLFGKFWIMTETTKNRRACGAKKFKI